MKIFFTEELSLVINSNLYLFELIALALIVIVVIKKNEVNSSAVALTVSLIVGFYSLTVAPKLLDWAKQSPDLKHAIRFFWYMGFLHVDLAAIYVIRKINGILKVLPGDICKLILLMFISRICAHSVRYIERLAFDTHYLELMYKTLMTSINATSTFTTLILAIIFFTLQVTPEKLKLQIRKFADRRLSFFPFVILTNKKWNI
ncbi:hypothetical protein CJF42_19380 [Pseudoalteromonas sp. NBT06-2]|uniref:hypothetical protein n=1 Tax=Pseudoalteromonas sp. NBT06-2 TaxID=2025950 RepID=UPI000BA66C0E|nr:hypothetical protein [Pseudoalteromonas sp. NBT06-2]PAJ72767.1 hypothetical protein CJF42_19380 [Pseudoalteromonas sp. NBT06-2]